LKKRKPSSPCFRESDILEAVQILKKGGTILYPTDTIYGLGCDATQPDAVDKIYAIKNRPSSKALIVLVDSMKMLDQYIEEVPEIAFDMIKLANSPLTIIYDRPKHLAENLIAEDNTIAIRVTKDPLCKAIIRGLRKPLVSTSANLSGETPQSQIDQMPQSLLTGVDHIVDYPLANKGAKPSSIVKLSIDGSVKVIR
jgi:L-threonylcarbamoyladenylate synthase